MFDQHTVVGHVNNLRAKHGSLPVVYSGDISKVSQAWASYLAATNKTTIEHNSDTAYGENIAFFSGTRLSMNGTAHVLDATNLWYNEIDFYDFAAIDPVPNLLKAGHFTQLVWVGSTHIGVGVSASAQRVFVVMNFSPAGNNILEVNKNVRAPVLSFQPMPPPPKSKTLTPPPPQKSPVASPPPKAKANVVTPPPPQQSPAASPLLRPFPPIPNARCFNNTTPCVCKCKC